MKSSSRLLISLAFLAACASSQSSPPARSVSTMVAPPSGTESLGVEWRSAKAPGVGTILLAVARPPGKGPFPALIILHGSHGFAREYVELAKELSKIGIVAVAACWFAPGEGPGLKFVSPIACPTDAPRMTDQQSQESERTISAVVAAIRALPGVNSDQIAMFGHSRGGGAVWNHILHGGKARAIILNSAGYTDELIQRATTFRAPVLILHGENDTVGPMTNVQRARKFESALRQSGKPVEAVYYPKGEHGSLFISPSQRSDELRHMKTFLSKNLRRK